MMAQITNTTNSNTPASAGVRGNDLSPTMQTYYDRKLLEEMKPKLVHAQFGQKRPIPANNGKTVKFRKYTPFEAKTTALTEGEPGDGQALTMVDKTATVAQYGGYVRVTDFLDLTALDPVINDAVEQMADQGALTLDTLTRDELTSGTDATNVIFANGTVRSAIASTDKLTSTLLRKAVRTLKKNKAPMFTDGGRPHYVAIVGPDTTYDLQDDADWKAVSEYQDKMNIYSGEIGMLYGCRIVETEEAKIFTADATIVGDNATLTTASTSAYSSANKTLALNGALSADDVTAIAGKKIVINGETATVVSAATANSVTTLTLKDTLASATATDYNAKTIYPYGGGKDGNDVAATLVLGKDGYGLIDVGGKGTVRTIIKPVGSAGTADPLDQMSTVGWKVDAFTAKILMPERVVRIEHGFSA